MKNNWLLFALLCFVVFACKKKENGDPISQLPAATQTGANTAGCLVNGVALLPKTTSFSNSTGYHCTYQYVKGDYFFTMAFDDESDVNIIKNVLIATDSLSIVQGKTYKLVNVFKPQNASGSYVVFSSHNPINEYDTNEKVSGELYISHFDKTKQIVSGTFFFDAINKSGDIVHITDGRFDMYYTQ